jgi:hypothetical protein
MFSALFSPEHNHVQRLFGRLGVLGADSRWQCCHHSQLRQANRIVTPHRKGELPAQLGQSGMARPAHASHRLGPAEGLLDLPANKQADCIAKMPRDPAINRQTPPVDMLRHMGCS